MHAVNLKQYGRRECINEDEKFYPRYYLVSLVSCLGYDSAILVNAEHEEEALDSAVDYAESQGLEGYFLEREDEEYYLQYSEVIYAGNHGHPLQLSEVYIERVYEV